ncbi:MAG: hypothetical protein RLZZ15_4232 [Verrucomicrobiota bacterium]|jgi:transposase
MVAGMFFLLRVGLPWRDLPAHFGPWSSVYTRDRRWCATGLFARMLELAAGAATGESRAVDCFERSAEKSSLQSGDGTC